MKNNLIRKCLVFGTTALMVGLIFGSAVNAGIIGNRQVFDIDADNGVSLNLDDGITNITVYEAWDLLNDTSNGVQIPVDVRTNGEWDAGFIDTPYPESPIHYCLSLLQDPTGLQEFLEKYDGEDVIMYCAKGGRSWLAANILDGAGFTGTIYSMFGGTTAWEAAGFPMRGNEPPNEPTITGKTNVKVGKEYDYKFKATDPNEDGVKYFIDWGDNNTEWTDYHGSGEMVTVKHTWNEKGNYTIKAKTQDFYGNESDWATLTVIVPKNKALNFNLNLFETSKLTFYVRYCNIYFQLQKNI